MEALKPLALIVGAYLIGSLSPAYALGRLIRGIDLREVGSRNLGARNAARTLGRPAGVLVWALDMAKGATAVLVSMRLGAPLPPEKSTPAHILAAWRAL